MGINNYSNTDICKNIEQCLYVLDEKIRSLEKGKNELDFCRNKLENGKKISTKEKEALSRYGITVMNLDFARNLKDEVSGNLNKVLKMQEELLIKWEKIREIENFLMQEDILKLQFLLRYLKSSSRYELVTDSNLENLKKLEEFGKIVHYNSISSLSKTADAADHLINYALKKDVPVVGTTYACLFNFANELIAKHNVSSKETKDSPLIFSQLHDHQQIEKILLEMNSPFEFLQESQVHKTTDQTSDETGQTSDETGKTSDETGKTSDETGQTSNETGQTSNETGQTRDETGQTSDENIQSQNQTTGVPNVPDQVDITANQCEPSYFSPNMIPVQSELTFPASCCYPQMMPISVPYQMSPVIVSTDISGTTYFNYYPQVQGNGHATKNRFMANSPAQMQEIPWSQAGSAYYQPQTFPFQLYQQQQPIGQESPEGNYQTSLPLQQVQCQQPFTVEQSAQQTSHRTHFNNQQHNGRRGGKKSNYRYHQNNQRSLNNTQRYNNTGNYNGARGGGQHTAEQHELSTGTE